RRIGIGPDHPYGSPGSVLLRELAPTRIAGECTKLPPRFGLEDVNAHGLGPFCACNPPVRPKYQRRTNCLRTGGRPAPARSSLCRKINRPFSRSYGDISIVTRSPARVLIRFFFIRPAV